MITLDEFLRHVGSGHGFLLTTGVSFFAGVVASAVCPCTLPVGIGIASVASASETAEQRTGIKIAAAFSACALLLRAGSDLSGTPRPDHSRRGPQQAVA